MKRTAPGKLARLVPLLVAIFFSSSLLLAAEIDEEFNLKEERVDKGNLLNLIFGSAPPLATERGILLIDAFNDQNGNGLRDAGESELIREVSCRVDGVDYALPAFIPGLENTASYQIACRGEEFQPVLDTRSIFFKRRGEIITVELPFRRVAPPGLKKPD